MSSLDTTPLVALAAALGWAGRPRPEPFSNIGLLLAGGRG